MYSKHNMYSTYSMRSTHIMHNKTFVTPYTYLCCPETNQSTYR